MQLSTEAQTRIYEIVENSVKESLENDPSKEFILAILSKKPDYSGFYGMFGTPKTMLQSETDRYIEGMVKGILQEIFSKEVRDKLKAAILAENIEDKILFAGKAAVNEFVERVKAPISGNLIKIRFGSDDEDEDENLEDVLLMEWETIETAPKDGSVFIGWEGGDSKPFPMYWSEKELYPVGDAYTGWVNAVDFNYDDGGSWRFETEPTHWMPLPEPPNEPS